jgi:hypothetical protein
MGYRKMGLTHAALLRARARLGACAGQGTVEYVALMLLVAGILTAVVAVAHTADVSTIPTTLANKIKQAIGEVHQAPAR